MLIQKSNNIQTNIIMSCNIPVRISGTLAQRPAASLAVGSRYHATDTSTIFVSTGSEWNAVTMVHRSQIRSQLGGPLTNRPTASASVGSIYIDETGQVYEAFPNGWASVEFEPPTEAVLKTDTSTAGMSFVIDEDNMASNSATKVPTQQSVKTYVDRKSHVGEASIKNHIGVPEIGIPHRFTLLNDSGSPGANKIYGTNGTGTKGWQRIPYTWGDWAFGPDEVVDDSSRFVGWVPVSMDLTYVAVGFHTVNQSVVDGSYVSVALYINDVYVPFTLEVSGTVDYKYVIASTSPLSIDAASTVSVQLVHHTGGYANPPTITCTGLRLDLIGQVK